MKSTALSLPRNVRNLPSVARLQSNLEAAKRRNSTLKEKVEESVSTAEAVGGACAGAALSGLLDAYEFGDGVQGLTAGGLIVAGMFTDQKVLIHTGVGVISPKIRDYVRDQVRIMRANSAKAKETPAS